MLYNWSIKNIKEARKKLLVIKENETSIDKKSYIDVILDSLNDYIEEEKGKRLVEEVDYNGRLAIIAQELDSYSSYYSLISLFYNITSTFRDRVDLIDDALEKKLGLEQSYGVLTGARISNDRALSLTDDFYKKFAPNLYPVFSQAFKQRKNSIRFVKSLGGEREADSVYFDIIKRYFLNITRTDDISKLYNIIHEYGHIISAMINPKAIYLTPNLMYTEVASMFPEMVSRYENIGNFDKAHVCFEDFVTLTGLMGSSINLSLHAPFINLWREHNFNVDETFFDEAEEYYDFDQEMVDDALDTYISDEGDYIISYLVAIELLNLYKRDKNKALKIFEEIMKVPYNEDLHAFVGSKLNLGSHLEEETSELLDKFTLNLKRSGGIHV